MAASGQLGWQIGTADLSSRPDCSRKYVNTFDDCSICDFPWKKKGNSSLVLMLAIDLCQTSGLVLLYLAELYLEDLFSRDLSLSVDECSMKLF